MNEVPMSQMHVLVSGEKNQFLMTYTDMGSEFEKSEFYDQAWAAMTSIKVKGEAPQRYKSQAIGGALIGLVVVLLGMIGFSIKKRVTKSYESYEDTMYSDDSEISSEGNQSLHTSAVWNLGHQEEHPHHSSISGFCSGIATASKRF